MKFLVELRVSVEADHEELALRKALWRLKEVSPDEVWTDKHSDIDRMVWISRSDDPRVQEADIKNSEVQEEKKP